MHMPRPSLTAMHHQAVFKLGLPFVLHVLLFWCSIYTITVAQRQTGRTESRNTACVNRGSLVADLALNATKVFGCRVPTSKEQNKAPRSPNKNEPRARISKKEKRRVRPRSRQTAGQQAIRAAPPDELAQAPTKISHSSAAVTTHGPRPTTRRGTEKIRRGSPPEPTKRTEPGLVLLGACSVHRFPPFKLLHPERVVAFTKNALKGDKPRRQDGSPYEGA